MVWDTTYQQTKLVKIRGDAIRHEAKLSDAAVELDRPTECNNLCNQVAGINSY